MKQEKGNKAKLGILVFSSILILIAGIYFIGQRQQLFNSTFLISGIFKDISGLQVGNNVRFSGITIGIIENIEQISDSTVRVDMLINKQSQKFIKKDAKAIIGSDGLMGNKILILIAGTSGKPQIADNDFVETTQPISMDEILFKINLMSENAVDITDDLAVIMDNIREGRGTVGKLFSDSTFAQGIDETLVNIKQGAGGFKKNMDAASNNILLKGFFKKKKKKNK